MVGSPFTAFTFCDLSDVHIQFRNCLKKDRAALLLQVITCWAVSYLQGNVRGEFNCNSNDISHTVDWANSLVKV